VRVKALHHRRRCLHLFNAFAAKKHIADILKPAIVGANVDHTLIRNIHYIKALWQHLVYLRNVVCEQVHRAVNLYPLRGAKQFAFNEFMRANEYRAKLPVR
jgi:hypothetical protein